MNTLKKPAEIFAQPNLGPYLRGRNAFLEDRIQGQGGFSTYYDLRGKICSPPEFEGVGVKVTSITTLPFPEFQREGIIPVKVDYVGQQQLQLDDTYELTLPKQEAAILQRAIWERKALEVAQGHCPHVVQYLKGIPLRVSTDYGCLRYKGGRRFLVADSTLLLAKEVEYYAGQSLKEELEEGISLADTLAVLGDTEKALDELHSVGIIHRDIKPGNIMVGRTEKTSERGPWKGQLPKYGIDATTPKQGSVSEWTISGKVIDLGLAIHVEGSSAFHYSTSLLDERTLLDEASIHAGLNFGTPGFVSPEQIRGSVGDKATDWYAFAVTMGVACVGKVPVKTICSREKHEELVAAYRDDLLGFWIQYFSGTISKALADGTALALRYDPALRDPTLLRNSLSALRSQYGLEKIILRTTPVIFSGSPVSLAMQRTNIPQTKKDQNPLGAFIDPHATTMLSSGRPITTTLLASA